MTNNTSRFGGSKEFAKDVIIKIMIFHVCAFSHIVVARLIDTLIGTAIKIILVRITLTQF